MHIRCNMASLLSVALQSNMTYATEAIKSQLEKGPVDVITGEARNSLSEEKLLRQHLDVNVVEGVVENENEVIPIKLLDTDTISQAKENILDALYKNTTVSRRPELGEVDLELRRGNARAGLYDYNEKDGEWVKVNTHGHDKLDQMGIAALRKELKESSAKARPEVAELVAAGGDEGETLRQGSKIIPEVFLTGLLATKRILQPYVDEALFTVPSGTAVPKPIKYLFDFLDLQAADMGITDPEVLHTWKTNRL
eukprot:Em0014g255a